MTDPRKYVGYQPKPEEMVLIPEHPFDDDYESESDIDEDDDFLENDEFVEDMDEDNGISTNTKQVEEEIEIPAFTPEFMSREELAYYFADDIQDIADQVIAKMISEQVDEIVAQQAQLSMERIEQAAFQEALHKRRGEIAQSIKNVDAKLEEIQKAHIDFLKKCAFELKYLSVDIAQKFVVTKLESNDTLLENLVVNTVSNIKNTSWLDIEVSDTLVGLIEDLKDQLQHSDGAQGRVVTVSPKPCSIDTVRVNTEEGTVVSTISTQADNLREYYKEMDLENQNSN